jgi:hypothetical protein
MLCETVVAKSLKELERVLVSVPPDRDPYVPAEKRGTLVLAGQAGRWVRPGYELSIDAEIGIGAMTGGGNCLGCPGLRYVAFTIRNGRPVVVSWDFWTTAFEAVRPSYAVDIVESLELHD